MAELPQRIAQWLPEARAAGSMYGQDPLLMLSICDRESRGDPNAQSPDGGLGLYQITRKYHPTFCDAVGPDGRPLWRQPAWNTLYAAALLHFNADLFDGVVPIGLVILPMIATFNASARRVREAIRELTQPCSAEQLLGVLDPLTTGGDYVSDVWSRFKSYVIQ